MHNDEIKGQTQGDKYNVVDMYMFQQYVCVHACMHVYVCECVSHDYVRKIFQDEKGYIV